MTTKLYALSDIGEFAVHFDELTGAHCTGALEGDFMGTPITRILKSDDPNMKEVLADIFSAEVYGELED